MSVTSFIRAHISYLQVAPLSSCSIFKHLNSSILDRSVFVTVGGRGRGDVWEDFGCVTTNIP